MTPRFDTNDVFDHSAVQQQAVQQQAVQQHRRAYRRGSGRERVLDAYARILIEKGVEAATLDAVAAQADISKGGLLHHFASKEAMVSGLCQRLVEEAKDRIQSMAQSTANPVVAYLRASMIANDTYSETLQAVTKLAGSGHKVVDDSLIWNIEAWQRALSTWIDDPAVARVIQLLGEGFLLHALAGLPPQQLDVDAVRYARDLAEKVGITTVSQHRNLGGQSPA